MAADKTQSNFMFDLISGIYSLFYGHQVKKFRLAVRAAKPDFDVSDFISALDVGCGTGALCYVLSENGLNVTGIDNSVKMIKTAVRKNRGNGIAFMHHDALNPLPFGQGAFDFSIASYVAHGLTPDERSKMIREVKRVSKHYVVLHEYGKRRKLTTDIIELLEGGNYFTFIKNIESELHEIFDDIKIIEVGKNGLWYVCKV